MAKFGRFVVSINDPVELLTRIGHAWQHDGRYASTAFITPVLYNKGDLVEPPPHYIAQPRLVYAQKPADPFSAEREYRYLLQAKHSAEPDHYLTLSVTCRDICTLATE